MLDMIFLKEMKRLTDTCCSDSFHKQASCLRIKRKRAAINRIYADPSTGISKQDLFTRPAVMPVYDCDETEKTDDSAARYEEDEFFE